MTFAEFKNFYKKFLKEQVHKQIFKKNAVISKKRLYGPFLWIGFNCLKATEPLRQWHDTVSFSLFSLQEFLVLNWSTLEGWKAELTLKPFSGFEPRTHELGLQLLHHQWKSSNVNIVNILNAILKGIKCKYSKMLTISVQAFPKNVYFTGQTYIVYW